jgi:hypothetical protein
MPNHRPGSVFTGKAGTGKSYLIHIFVVKLEQLRSLGVIHKLVHCRELRKILAKIQGFDVLNSIDSSLAGWILPRSVGAPRFTINYSTRSSKTSNSQRTRTHAQAVNHLICRLCSTSPRTAYRGGWNGSRGARLMPELLPARATRCLRTSNTHGYSKMKVRTSA